MLRVNFLFFLEFMSLEFLLFFVDVIVFFVFLLVVKNLLKFVFFLFIFVVRGSIYIFCKGAIIRRSCSSFSVIGKVRIS